MKKVFISHPYSGNEEENFKRVDSICKSIERDYDDVLPISPLHLWSFMSEDGKYRNDILTFCFRIIDNCDKVLFYKYDKFSEGQQAELRYSREIGKPIDIIEMR